MNIIIRGAQIINEEKRFVGSVRIDNDRIAEVIEGDVLPDCWLHESEIIEADGLWLLPGVIDDQVHFREPGLTHKGDIANESRAAAAGGVTSYMEMPNTNPPTTSLEALQAKFDRASEVSAVNYSFYLGATNDNLATLKKIDQTAACGVKLFMGSSTGNMLVDDEKTLAMIFSEVDALIAVHAEDESTVRRNMELFRQIYGDEVPISMHPLIRSEEACFITSSKAVELATKYNGRLHLLHLSTARELTLLSDAPLSEKRITGEVCVHHLWFNDGDYERYGSRIKWNPAIKTESDRLALLRAVSGDRLDVIATDHAPHLLSEKEGGALKAASGGPLVQFSLLAMLELTQRGDISLERVVRKMCHAPADLYRIQDRGYIRPKYFADLVLVDPSESWTLKADDILSKCGWSPFEGDTFSHRIHTTFVNGQIVYRNGAVDPSVRGRSLTFIR